jgi:hypothetical protein
MRANVITSLASGALVASLCGIASALPVAHQMRSTMSPMRQATPTTLSPAHATGQPNQSCGSATAPNTPGQAAVAPGSAFNPDGKAGTVYAGQQPQNSRNTASVSQYDVACFHQR